MTVDAVRWMAERGVVDDPDVEPLAAACRELGRWTFLLVVAPMRVTGATGLPVNPLAT